MGDSPADRLVAWAHTPDRPEWGAAAALRQVAVYGWALFSTDWISWPVALWLAVCATVARIRVIRLPGEGGMDPGFTGAGRLILFGALFTVAVAVVGPQEPGRTVANVPLRYMLPAIVFVLVLKGLFCEWVWRRNRWMGVAALAGLLLTFEGRWTKAAKFSGWPVQSARPELNRHLPEPPHVPEAGILILKREKPLSRTAQEPKQTPGMAP